MKIKAMKKSENILHCFEPVIDQNTKVMIIGTMPGEASLVANEYYAYKHNALWKIMARLYNSDRKFADYGEKLSCLRENGIGLWDNLHSCERSGSLDSDIKNAEPNDFETLCIRYPALKCFLFNGQQSYKFFKKFHPALLEKYEYYILPSTSPANASISFDEKLKHWKEALFQA